MMFTFICDAYELRLWNCIMCIMRIMHVHWLPFSQLAHLNKFAKNCAAFFKVTFATMSLLLLGGVLLLKFWGRPKMGSSNRFTECCQKSPKPEMSMFTFRQHRIALSLLKCQLMLSNTCERWVVWHGACCLYLLWVKEWEELEEQQEEETNRLFVVRFSEKM